jgi:hypothetical protein
MTTSMDTERLIEQLSTQLEPVRPLKPPPVRALLWLGIVAVLTLTGVLRYANLAVFARRMAEPRIAVECVAIALTAVTAVVSAFYLAVPGRSPRWRWLPLPPLLLWLGASGLGCLRNGLSLHGADGFVGESAGCFKFIAAVSVPLAVALFALLRRARPIAPLPVAMLGALGVAATAAFVLEFFHPFDVTVIDLALHLAAVALVMLVCMVLRRPLLAAD